MFLFFTTTFLKSYINNFSLDMSISFFFTRIFSKIRYKFCFFRYVNIVSFLHKNIFQNHSSFLRFILQSGKRQKPIIRCTTGSFSAVGAYLPGVMWFIILQSLFIRPLSTWGPIYRSWCLSVFRSVYNYITAMFFSHHLKNKTKTPNLGGYGKMHFLYSRMEGDGFA